MSHSAAQSTGTSKMGPDDHKNSEDSQATSEYTMRHCSPPDHPLTYADMLIFAVDIKHTFFSAITELKADMLALNERAHTAEHLGQKRDKAISRLESVSTAHTAQLIAVNRHLEDLDNGQEAQH